MTTLNERVKLAIEWSGLTQEEVAQKSGISQSAIHKIISGKSRNTRFIIPLSNTLKVDPEWIQDGKGEAPLFSRKNIPENCVPLLEWEEVTEWLKNGSKNLNMNPKERTFFASPVLDMPHRRKIFAVKIKNDSMTSLYGNSISFIPSISILFAEPILKVKYGDYVIVLRRNEKEPILRQIIKEGDKVSLKPINAQYQKEDLDDDILPLAVVLEKREPLFF